MNLIGVLNQIADQYTNTKYVSKTRHMGYSNQIEKCTSLSSCTDGGYENDVGLVGSLAATTPDGGSTHYWLAARYRNGNSYGYYYVNMSGVVSTDRYLRTSTTTYTWKQAVRPILTLKANVGISGGKGTKSSPYQLA